MRRENQRMLHDMGRWPMLKVWLGLELRQLMTLSVRIINDLVKTDQLCPSY